MVDETIVNDVVSEAVDQTVAEISGKEDYNLVMLWCWVSIGPEESRHACILLCFMAMPFVISVYNHGTVTPPRRRSPAIVDHKLFSGDYRSPAADLHSPAASYSSVPRLLSSVTMTKFRKLNRPTGHRISMLRTMVSQLVKHERIETTVAKAKEVRRLADNMVQLGKEGTLCAARRAAAFVRGDDVIHKLFTELAYRYK
ncbi:hypothetical protein F0562_017597 [Nyssa sinensis]|uniref:Ribosomal protein L17 n=1 Tax=Nyssa sinensis TaxID=561372 RepID=A0A5J4ZHE0_9ASTE|nr:hypothetical protein F0562_017597 [Nyssa sinensis]